MTCVYDFANILFAGPCNLHCPYCIGRQLDPQLNRNNLNDFPLNNLARFVYLLQQNNISQLTFSGTTTDPQLYRHEARLLAQLRAQLSEATQISLHTNGQLALHKMEVFNQYNRACISFPSFNADTYRRMTGSTRVPDLAEIVRRACIPIKVSCIITEHNANETDIFLARCQAIGIKRVVFRRLYGDPRPLHILPRLTPVSAYRGNPVYRYHGLEITLWNFHHTRSRSLNLFSNGLISPHYLLTSARSRIEC